MQFMRNKGRLHRRRYLVAAAHRVVSYVPLSRIACAMFLQHVSRITMSLLAILTFGSANFGVSDYKFNKGNKPIDGVAPLVERCMAFALCCCSIEALRLSVKEESSVLRDSPIEWSSYKRLLKERLAVQVLRAFYGIYRLATSRRRVAISIPVCANRWGQRSA
jgi:hypothetical protein